MESAAYWSSATTPAREAWVEVSVLEQVNAEVMNSAFLIFVERGLLDSAVLVKPLQLMCFSGTMHDSLRLLESYFSLSLLLTQ